MLLGNYLYWRSKITIFNIASYILWSIIVKVRVSRICILLILIFYQNIVNFTKKSRNTIVRESENGAFKKCCLWSNIQYGGQEHRMIKKLICWKIAKFNYILKSSLDKKIIILKVGNNVINYNSYPINNSQWYTLVG